jgi:tetratricopeptide (TPR) repeat protein
MRKMLAFNMVALALAATQLFAIGEARMTGNVVDTSGKPIPDATITVDATEGHTFHQVFKAAKNGAFAIFLLDGTIHYDFLVAKEGFNSVKENMKLQLAPEKNTRTFTLAPPTQVAAPVAVPKADPSVDAYNAGVELYNDGKIVEAIAKFEEAVAAKPELEQAYHSLTLAYERTKNWKKVISNGTKSLELSGDDSDINVALGEAYEATGDKAKAAEFRKKAPANPAALFNQAARLINAGKDKEAEPLLKEALAADPKMAVGYYELGMLYARSGKNADARTNLSKYLELAPNGKDAATAKEMLSYVK